MKSQHIFIEWDDSGFTIKIDTKVFETDYCGMFDEDQGMVLVDAFKHLGHMVEYINHFEHDEDSECKVCNG